MERQIKLESAEKLQIIRKQLNRDEKRIAEFNRVDMLSQSIHIKYDGLGFIPLDELMKEERRDQSHAVP